MQRRTYVLVFMNSFAHFCHDCVWEGRYEKGVKEHQHRSAKQSFWLISSLLVKKRSSSKVEDTDLTSDQHNFILESWTLIFFVHIWFLPCRSEKPPNPQGHFSEADWKWTDPKARSHQFPSVCKFYRFTWQTIWSWNVNQSVWYILARICWIFLGWFFKLVYLSTLCHIQIHVQQQGLSHDTSNSDFQDTSLIHLVPSPARSQRREMWDRWIFPFCSGLRYQELWLRLIWQATCQRIEHII